MRSLYEAIIDNDDQVISSIESTLVVQHVADCFLDVFGSKIDAFKVWSSYGITFRDFPTNKAYDASKPAKLSASWFEDGSKYNTTGVPLNVVYPKFNKLVDEFKKKLEKLKNVKRVEDTVTLDDPIPKVYIDKSTRNLKIIFEDNLDINKLNKFDIEFITNYVRGVGKRSLKNPDNIFVEVYARFHFYDKDYHNDILNQFIEIIEKRRKK